MRAGNFFFWDADIYDTDKWQLTQSADNVSFGHPYLLQVIKGRYIKR